MKETVGLHSSFEDIYASRETSQGVYARVSALAQIPAEPVSVESVPTEQAVTTARIEMVSPYEQVLQAYREKPHTPELVGAFHNAYWQQRAAKAGIIIPTMMFEGRAREISKHERNGDMIVSIPSEVMKDRARLMQLFPEYTGHYALAPGNPFQDNIELPEFFYTEASINAPFTGKNEEQLKEEFNNRRRQALIIPGYFIAGQMSKEITGKYLDQDGTWVRLLNSSGDGGVVDAEFDPGGDLDVGSDLDPRDRGGDLGGRSFSGVK